MSDQEQISQILQRQQANTPPLQSENDFESQRGGRKSTTEIRAKSATSSINATPLQMQAVWNGINNDSSNILLDVLAQELSSPGLFKEEEGGIEPEEDEYKLDKDIAQIIENQKARFEAIERRAKEGSARIEYKEVQIPEPIVVARKVKPLEKVVITISLIIIIISILVLCIGLEPQTRGLPSTFFKPDKPAPF
ncbi:MAG: hypothetical protein EZS28_016761 [Streblomastix strix]|uniref:Uncharacterized protein n=1 Tax=Streblomastix strix TaxID=222440 RepID=A0A5J4VYP9_9EUKA|nr:MAG: hypothetical protein EZS28_016761 [Streblomastix strix]